MRKFILLSLILFSSANAVMNAEESILALSILGPGDDNGTIGDNTRPKAPITIPSVSQDGYTLYLYSGCVGATLRLLDADEEEAYSVEITDEMGEILLPATLSGTYRLEIVRGAFTFYCYITL